MAKRLEKFTGAFAESRIPFALAEVVTNGRGEMVDLICRFINGPAAALLETTPDALQGLRFSHAYSAERLRALAPLAEVAFSGSAASFPYVTVLGRNLTLTCYQPVYGLAACVLEGESAAGTRDGAELLAQALPGGVAVLELGSRGARVLSFNSRLCEMARCSRKEFFSRYANDLSPLVHEDDWDGLLQRLMDSARDGLSVDCDFRMNCRTGGPIWVNLRTALLSSGGGVTSFYAMVLDIDQRRREQAELERLSRSDQALRQRYDHLLDSLPGGYFLLESGADGVPALRRVSQGLCGMLGYSESEIFRRIAADPLWHIHPDDRESLQTLFREWNGEDLLRAVFRTQQKGGGGLWLSLEARRERAEAGILIYGACADVSGEQAVQEEQRFRAQLAELLLEGEDCISLDYSPQGDTARLELPDGAGSRRIQTLPEYRKGLSVSSTVHPDDRKRLQAALRQASSRPGRSSLEYLGNYGGTGYRWYRAALVSLADDRGTVYRIVGKSEDITPRKAARERFSRLEARQAAQARQALCFVRLDLTANRLLDAGGQRQTLTRRLFANTADECLHGMAEASPDEGDRLHWDALFTRDRLLDAYARGESRCHLEHRFLENGQPARWVRSSVELAEQPDTHHIQAFFRMEEAEARRRRELATDTLLSREFDCVLTIDVQSRRCIRCDGALPFEEEDFYKLALGRIERLVPPENRKQARAAILLPTVLRRLKKAARYEYACPLLDGDGGVLQKRYCFSWLDDGRETLLLTGRDVTEEVRLRKAREQFLVQGLETARTASQAKSDYLAQLSHEVRIPVDAALELARAAGREPGLPLRTAEALHRIEGAARYLQSLTGDLLDMSRIESGKLTLRTEAFSLSELMDSVCGLASVSVSASGALFGCAVAPQLENTYLGDRSKLQQILLNLLDNAARFTPAGGRVSLEVSQAEKKGRQLRVRFVVSDTGCGISETLLPTLFEPFVRSGDAAAQSSGLGLAICRSLTELMGGVLDVSSIEGVGSRFTLEVPLKLASGGGSAASGRDLSGLRILLAEQREEAAGRLTGLLEQRGCAVERVPDGPRALQQFASQPAGFFSAVVEGTALPVMDGVQTAAAIRCWDKQDAATIPIVLLSDTPSEADRLRGEEAGVTAVLAAGDHTALLQILAQLAKHA